MLHSTGLEAVSEVSQAHASRVDPHMRAVQQCLLRSTHSVQVRAVLLHSFIFVGHHSDVSEVMRSYSGYFHCYIYNSCLCIILLG
jgi:hypothetical protein